jgi:hypothetical protein
MRTHAFFRGMLDALSDMETPALMLFCWIALICTAVVVSQCARSALQCFKTWHRERRRYKLPKPPDNYRLN